jgi:hypothetical protein
MYNANCDGSGPCSPGQVRLLPTGRGGNAILCHACFVREVLWRQQRNRELGAAGQFDTPAWSQCEVYGDNVNNETVS